MMHPLRHVKGSDLSGDTAQTGGMTPDAEEAVVVIARSSQETVVVNLPSLYEDSL